MPNNLQIAHTLSDVKHVDSKGLLSDSTILNRMPVTFACHFGIHATVNTMNDETVGFEKVKDKRGKAIRGLWRRRNVFYTQFRGDFG